MKKLAFLVMILAIATLMGAKIAWTDDQPFGGVIQGTYAMIATGSCLHSTLGFNGPRTLPTGDPIWNPKPGSVVWAASTMAQATWRFERDWTGLVSDTNYIIDFPPGNPNPPFLGPAARQNVIYLPFTYDVTPHGEITVTFNNPAVPPLHGNISIDHKTLTIENENVIQPFGASPSSVICNTGRVLIRAGE